jgi:hypothetical protein
LSKILQVVLADNAAIKHPHPTLHPILALDLLDDLFESSHVGGPGRDVLPATASSHPKRKSIAVRENHRSWILSSCREHKAY